MTDPSGRRNLRAEVSQAQYDGLFELVEVMDRLRSPGGCPWDAAQTHESLAKYAIEEAHEFAEAAGMGDRAEMLEELGDMLLQVVFNARIAEEHATNPFDIEDVAQAILAKLKRRHPHVFADTAVDTLADVARNWESIKRAEKHRDSVIDGIPVAMPALARAQKLIGRARRGNLDLKVGSSEVSAGFGERLLALVAEAETEGQEAEDALRDAVRGLELSIRGAEATVRGVD